MVNHRGLEKDGFSRREQKTDEVMADKIRKQRGRIEY